jgi:nicotinic acid mononucleotide adenylyltransferase
MEPGTEAEWVVAGRPGIVGSRAKDAAKRLNRQFGEGKWRICYVIRGSDVVSRMLRWPSLPALLRHHILVVVRPGFDPWEKFGKDETFRLHNARFSILPRPFEDGLSSSYVRERLLQGQSIRYLVPEAVRNYIAETRCYG